MHLKNNPVLTRKVIELRIEFDTEQVADVAYLGCAEFGISLGEAGLVLPGYATVSGRCRSLTAGTENQCRDSCKN